MQRRFKYINGISKDFDYCSQKNAFESILWFIFVVVCIGGCKKFVQIPPPTDKVATASIFSDNVTATAAVMNIYSNMRDKGMSFYLSQHSGLLADELQNYSSNSDLLAYYENALSATQSSTFPWVSAYNYVYQANAIIEGLERYTGVLP